MPFRIFDSKSSAPLCDVLNEKGCNTIASNFKLFSKQTNSPLNIDPKFNTYAAYSFAYAQLLSFLVFLGLLMFAYYRKEDLQQFYDSHMNSMIGQLWVFTHLNSSGELSSTYVPNDFSLYKWIPGFDKNE